MAKQKQQEAPSGIQVLLGTILLPISLFTLLGLVSYDWTDIPIFFLESPASQVPSNWVGPVGWRKKSPKLRLRALTKELPRTAGSPNIKLSRNHGMLIHPKNISCVVLWPMISIIIFRSVLFMPRRDPKRYIFIIFVLILYPKGIKFFFKLENYTL